MMNRFKPDRKFVVQLLLLQLGLLVLVTIAHISVLHAVRSMEANQFVRTHRNDIVGGNWRRVELSGDFLNSENFQSIKLAPKDPGKHESFVPGRITRTIYLDEQEMTPFGEVRFRYDTFHRSWFSLLFLMMIDIVCLAIMVVIRRQLDKQVRQEQEVLRLRSITQSVQMIAHDVRKPFFMVNGILDGINANEFSDPKELQNLTASAKRVSVQVDEMLADVLALDAKVKVNPIKVYPRELFLVSKAIVSLRFPNLSFYVNPSTTTLSVDSTKMQRVFTNIIMNAAEAMKGEGKIWCEISEIDNRFAKVEIGNTNSYISPEKCERIFLPFYCGDESKGSGLGLAIVRNFVEAHGGVISVRSSKKDGTVFTMTLPLALDPQDQIAKAPLVQRIAIVEDCPLTMYRWRQLLDLRADYFSSPKEFLASIQPHDTPYTLVVTDFYFDNDELTGHDLGKKAKENWPHCEVVMATNDLTQRENAFISRVLDKQDIHAFVSERFGTTH